MKLHYLEIVTPDVEPTCDALARAHAVSFGPPVAALGNARTAKLSDGSRVGVRAPMRGAETPVVRPYMLVMDLASAVNAVRAAGAAIALERMEIPGEGTIAIYFVGGNQHGLWQVWAGAGA